MSAPAAPRVLVCGDVINDILVETRGPLIHGDDNPARIRRCPGGSAANQAAWMATLGLDVVFAGRAGAPDADFHRRELARFGVDPRLRADESAATGSIVVLVDPDGERTMLTDRGANLRLSPADVPAELLDGVALVHLTGYSFFHPAPREVALGLMAEAAARGVPVTVDPGSAAFLAMLEPGAFLAWTRGAAVCFPNHDEAAVLVGTASRWVREGGPEPAALARPADPLAVAARLSRYYGAVALKLGPEGAALASADTVPVQIPAVAATVRDTTGAGDAFCAGFLAAWLTGAAPLAATKAGLDAAALSVSALGGRPDPDYASDGQSAFTSIGSGRIMGSQAERIMPVIVELPAEIDVTNSDQVYQRLVGALEPGVEIVIANLTSTSFCDSSGVRAIIHAYETSLARNVRLQLAVLPQGSVRRVLQLTGVGSLVPLYPSLEEAVNAV